MTTQRGAANQCPTCPQQPAWPQHAMQMLPFPFLCSPADQCADAAAAAKCSARANQKPPQPPNLIKVNPHPLPTRFPGFQASLSRSRPKESKGRQARSVQRQALQHTLATCRRHTTNTSAPYAPLCPPLLLPFAVLARTLPRRTGMALPTPSRATECSPAQR